MKWILIRTGNIYCAVLLKLHTYTYVQVIDFKSSPGSREFDVLSLPCGGAFDKGGEFEPEVLKFCSFSHASCMHRKDFAFAANTVFSDFEVKETGMEKLCASFEGMYYKIV
jgi:hypothetical protein